MTKQNLTIKQVRIYGHVNDKLNDLVKKRKAGAELIDTKQMIVADLIIKAHKKECS